MFVTVGQVKLLSDRRVLLSTDKIYTIDKVIAL